MKKTLLKEYAKVIVRNGVNVQKGQDVIINANVNENYFVKYVVEECYRAKARKVTVNWTDSDISRLSYKYENLESLSEIEDWKIKKLEHQVEVLPAMIHLVSDDPDAFNDVDQNKMNAVRMKTGPIMLKYREMMDNKYQWTIVGVPGEKWAKKIFPNENKFKAVEKLWETILKVTRIDGNSVENWKKHNEYLRNKCEVLNNLGIKTLYYKSSNGTDFNVSIDKKLRFAGGSETTLGVKEKKIKPVEYNPNMPTEEVFTSPIKTSANGVVYSTKPLSVSGVLVDNFGFRFENGKVVEVFAQNEKHKEVLEHLIKMDEGSSRLGEVALVPFTSPVNQTNLIFFNTLYDENACCHLALGRAFNECIDNYENLTEAQIKEIDLNTSMIHVDFMIGSSDLNIEAETYSGQRVQIFKDGVWAI